MVIGFKVDISVFLICLQEQNNTAVNLQSCDRGAGQHRGRLRSHRINIKRFFSKLWIPGKLLSYILAMQTEVSADPADVKAVHNHLQCPVLFLFTQRETLALDRSTAESVARRLRGEAGVVLVHRDHPGVNVPAGHNVAYRLPAEGSRVKYLTLQDVEGVVRLFTEGDRVGLEEEEEEELEEHWSVLDILDDDVSESV
ncbi:thioredoxin domain-containing protein 16-like [Polyodon spathula]|uniref:thioredoxin domain-containing protein 16-like n=1 Tax=Polyodon spathula TaxID=7913 RepID=UPI001B7D92AD|nr:thioredoxin domain-containing protein 16-like [Polyodon spathula]